MCERKNFGSMKCSKPAAKHIFIPKKAAFAENPEALLPNNLAAQKILRRYCLRLSGMQKGGAFLSQKHSPRKQIKKNNL